jgi:hypothetical protein
MSTVRARRAPVDLTPVLNAVSNDWEPGKVIAERAGIDPKTGGPRLAALVRSGEVEFMESPELDARVYRLARADEVGQEVAVLPPAAVQITPTSWTPTEPMSFEDWAQAGANLQSIARSVNWLLGDWLAYGERNFGEMYTQAIELTGMEYQTLANIVWVAKRVEPSRRRETLSWAHHETVASLKPAEQDKWLGEAESEGMTRNRLRSRLQGTPKDAPDPDQRLAATHMGRITFKLVAESDESAHQKVKELSAKLERLGVSVTHETASAL